MPRKSWTKKDERKYEGILESCKLTRRKDGRTVADCKRIAAATVNRDRKVRLGGPRRKLSEMSPREQTEQMALDMKAAKFFDSLTSYGDSAEDRRAAFRLVQEKYPHADFRRLVAGYGLSSSRGLGAIRPEDAEAAIRSTRSRVAMLANDASLEWQMARAQAEHIAEELRECRRPHPTFVSDTLGRYGAAMMRYAQAEELSYLAQEPTSDVADQVQVEASDFAKDLALAFSYCDCKR